MNAIATSADASVIDYAAVRVGQATNTEVSGISFDDGMTYGAAVGKAVGPFRVELGVDRIQGDLNFGGPSIQGEALDYHASAFLDWNVGDRASVFAGAGVDYVDASASIFGTEINASGQGWNYAYGAAYRVSDHIVGEVQVRHLEADGLSTDFGDVDLSSEQITVGFRFAL